MQCPSSATKKLWILQPCGVEHKQFDFITFLKDTSVQLSNNNTLPWEQMETVRLLKGAPGTQYQSADAPNQAIMRDWIRSLLQTTCIQVTFVKADGTLRNMLCTLKPDIIPAVPEPKTTTGPVDGIVREAIEKKPRKQPDVHSCRVYDIEAQGWRSFRYDRLQSVSATLNFTAAETK